MDVDLSSNMYCNPPKKHVCKKTDKRNAKWEIALQKPVEVIQNLT